MAYTPFHVDWKNAPDSSTPVTDLALEHIESGISAAAAAADAALAAVSGLVPWVHSMGDAANGMTLPTVSDSGHPMTWVTNDGGAPGTGQIGGVGAYWGFPGARVCYQTAELPQPIRWVRARFFFIPGSGGTGGTACIAITDRELEYPINSALHMAVHFWSTRTTWAMTVWANNAQAVLASGTYAAPLQVGTNVPIQHQMWAGIYGDSVIYRTPDGRVYKLTDSRFAEYGGRFAFSESFSPGATDDVVCIADFAAGSTVTDIAPVPLSTDSVPQGVDNLYQQH